MKYQLVIQFVAESLEDFDNLITLEETMRTKLELSLNTFVDGHDFGLGEFNIFIHRDEPHITLKETRNIIEEARPSQSFSAGYRSFSEDRYTAIWPPNADQFAIA